MNGTLLKYKLRLLCKVEIKKKKFFLARLTLVCGTSGNQWPLYGETLCSGQIRIDIIFTNER